MKSVLWRQTDQFGVVYTEDREHLQRLLAMDQFPLKREEDAAIYRNARGRIFAWQATFKLSLWNRVVRALGRSEIEIRQEAEARGRRAVKPATAAAPPPASSRPRRRPMAAPSPLPGDSPARPDARPKRSAAAAAAPGRPAKAAPALRAVPKTALAAKPPAPRPRKAPAPAVTERPESRAGRAKRESPPIAAAPEAKAARSRRSTDVLASAATPASKAATARAPKALPAQTETKTKAPHRGRSGQAKEPVTTTQTKKAAVLPAAGRKATAAPEASARVDTPARSRGPSPSGSRVVDMPAPSSSKRRGSGAAPEASQQREIRPTATPKRKAEAPSQKSPGKSDRAPLPTVTRSKGSLPALATDPKREGSRRLQPTTAAVPASQAASPARRRSPSEGKAADLMAQEQNGTRRGAAPKPKRPAQTPAPKTEIAAPTKAAGRRQKPVPEEQPELALELPAPVKRTSRAKAAPTARAPRPQAAAIPAPVVAPPSAAAPLPRRGAARPAARTTTRRGRSSR